jgi:hypothetical protein
MCWPQHVLEEVQDIEIDGADKATRHADENHQPEETGLHPEEDAVEKVRTEMMTSHE